MGLWRVIFFAASSLTRWCIRRRTCEPTVASWMCPAQWPAEKPATFPATRQGSCRPASAADGLHQVWPTMGAKLAPWTASAGGDHGLHSNGQMGMGLMLESPRGAPRPRCSCATTTPGIVARGRRRRHGHPTSRARWAVLAVTQAR